MKTILLMTATLLLATPAGAGGISCDGTVRAGRDWVETRQEFEWKCIITNSSLRKRLLKVCPIGSECAIFLVDERSYKVSRAGKIITVTKWPDEVERIMP